jgi:Rrf2 family protein
MKLSAQEEYGLRCLLRLAREGESGSLTIPEISLSEGISSHYVAKLMRVLRRGGFVRSARGQAGGYTLSRRAHQIAVGEALAALGGRLYEPGFCEDHSGSADLCTNTVDCSIRSLWRAVQQAVDQVLAKITLRDLMSNEEAVSSWAGSLVKTSSGPTVAEDFRILP